ncbi:hypothetical protein [Adhaeribacter soli]|uniref:Lipoprotein n=1 Tax=Adhaeribacter soli TaxID=2607655 RepID=A0A5N1IW93_9BACT|nr:hypothetical protein [Adhaeribacter soli]KAA9338785.1 hypothetical protein F0P94_08270 [Adhaeribacter soli]
MKVFRNLKLFSSTVAMTCMLYSCSVIRVVEVDSPTSNCPGSGQNFCNNTTINSSLWKSKNKLNIKSNCPNGISRVKVTTKPIDVVVGFLTAGFVIKQRIDWDCSQRSGSSDIDL